jgi:dTDP-4-amino-4,6-dideoxy-D-galactose acyltransferase
LDNKEGIEFLENNKFHFQDLKLSYKMNLNMNEKNENIDYKIAVEEDIEDIKRISRELFYYSRFNILGERASKEIYEIWAEKAIKGEFDDICLKVEDENNKTAGFITLKKISEKEAKIGIIAVERNKQKAGYGKILMDGAKKYLLEQEIDKFYVVTQGKNINAQNFYINSGFRMDKIEMWYYRKEV